MQTRQPRKYELRKTYQVRIQKKKKKKAGVDASSIPRTRYLVRKKEPCTDAPVYVTLRVFPGVSSTFRTPITQSIAVRSAEILRVLGV